MAGPVIQPFNLSGVWYNELGSKMVLKVTGNAVEGLYYTTVGDATGTYKLSGRTNTLRSVLGWVVTWQNEYGDEQRSTSWSAQIIDPNRWVSMWLLTHNTPAAKAWGAIQVGQDTWTRTAHGAVDSKSKPVQRAFPAKRAGLKALHTFFPLSVTKRTGADKQDLFCIKAFQRMLRTEWLGRFFRYHLVVDSTMNIIKRAIEIDAPTGTVALAECQTRGKGRQNRTWTSEFKGNLYFSFLVRPREMKNQKINFGIAVAVAQACHDVGVKVGIKWPNDIIYKGKKLCGMLVNAISCGNEVALNIGVGINVNEVMGSSDNKEVSMIATSLKTARGKKVSRERVLASFFNTFERLLALPFEKVLNIYRKFDILVGNQVTVMPKKQEHTKSYYEAKAVGFSNDGSLLVMKSGSKNRIALVAEEVSIRSLMKGLQFRKPPKK